MSVAVGLLTLASMSTTSLAARPLLVLAVLVAGCFNVSWGDGEPVDGDGTSGRRTVEADGVRRVHLGAPGTLVIERGAAPLVMGGDQNLLDQLLVDVDDGELSIETPSGASFRPQVPLVYRIGIDRLEGVAIAGSGRVEATGAEADAFALEMAGSGGAVVRDLRTARVSVEIAGSGDVTLAGQTGALTVEIAGSGDVDAADLDAETAEVDVAGAGDVVLRAAKTLDVSIMGAGDVRYYGSPEVSRQVMGAGDVSRAGD